MKTILSVQRAALLALALGSVSATVAFAQTTNTPSTTAPTCSAGGFHHHDSVLTADEKAQLKKAHKAALAANPSLQSEQASLKQQFETLKSQGKDSTTKDQWKALHEQAHTFHQNLRTAELSIDPTLAPIFAKLDAARKHWHHSS
jgi:seryl-tRNA synthetase